MKESLAIEGPACSGKTRMLIERAVDLLNTQPSGSILILCSNYYRKAHFLEQIQARIHGGFSQLQVTTYSALVRNTLSLFWPSVEELIVSGSRLQGKPVIFPELSGFEASEYMIKKIVGRLKAQYPSAFTQYQGSDRSLITQLLRRIRLRSENRLEPREMRRRSELIEEICLQEVEEALKIYDIWSLQLRVLDNSKQLDAFHRLLRDNSQVQDYFQGSIKHLVVDDVDETIPAQQHFIKWLAPSTDTIAIAADIDGGTRRGYLNAYPYDWEGLKALRPEIETIRLKREDSVYQIAQQLLRNWTAPPENTVPTVLPVKQEIQWRAQSITRLDMINQAVADILQLLQHPSFTIEGRPVKPGDLVIVMPKVDTLARLQIQQQLKCRGIPLQVLTGTQRPSDNPVCRSLLLLLQLANQDAWQLPLSSLEFKGILRHALKLHHVDPKGLEDLVEVYRRNPQRHIPDGEGLNPVASARYQSLRQWLECVQQEPIDEQFYSAFKEIISPQLTPEDELADLNQLIRSLYLCQVAEAFLDQSSQKASLAAQEWLIQTKTGIVADSPSKPKELDLEAIVLGTPQKIIDFEIDRPIHLWLDVSSREWSRTDNAPLYNAWVHSVNWDGDTTAASDQFNQRLARTRAGHITRTLLLYARNKVFLYSSDLDDVGNTHCGIFPDMLLLPQSESVHPVERATLREDQAPILQYRQGAMAITAVPGAGKTFVNVELLLEMIAQGIAPESILVLTYMESAARTLLGRLKNKLKNHQRVLPVVSTIHSLAFRMITEDDHALYLGLDPASIEIIDELEERDLLQPIVDAIDGGENYFRNVDTVLQGIKLGKSYRIQPDALKVRCAEKGILGGRVYKFALIYEAYHYALKQLGKLDFTDLINKAIDLLENNPEVREKYQNRFAYIIEDEAQDSSLQLQRFIELLQQRHGNLIRTGDTNQSITTTFSTADTSVFRDFIAHCHQSGIVVKMNQSGRCAQPVIDLANRFIDWACQDEVLKNAFQPVTMKAVPGHNPELLEKTRCVTFETSSQEQKWIQQEITRLQQDYPGKSIAILVRNNTDVLALAKLLQDAGLQVISFTDLPDLNPVFLLVVSVLQVLENPAEEDSMRMLLTQMLSMGLLHNTGELAEAHFTLNLFSLQPADIENPDLLQLYYNLQDLIRYAFGQDICRLVVRLTDMFFTEPQQRSIGYLCAIKAQEWVEQASHADALELSPLERVNQEFKRFISKKRLPFKVLQEETGLSAEIRNRFVQIMTLHKAKGQEFDLVFIPGMTERSFASAIASAKWREGDKLELEIERLRMDGTHELAQLTEAKKLKKVEEEARLVYVGITRAKQGLLISCPMEARDWRGKPEKQQPSRYFEALRELAGKTTPQIEEDTVYA